MKLNRYLPVIIIAVVVVVTAVMFTVVVLVGHHPAATATETPLLATPTAASTATPLATATNTPAPTPQAIIPADATAIKQVAQITLTDSGRIIWALDGKTFTVTTTNGYVQYDAQSLQPLNTVQFQSPIQLLDVSPDGNTIAISPDMINVELRDITNTQVKFDLKPGYSQNYGASFSPDGKTLLTPAFDTWQADLWNVATGQKVNSLTGFTTNASNYTVRMLDNQTIVWVASATAQLQEIDSSLMGPSFIHEDSINDVALSPDGKILATTAAGSLNGQLVPLVYLWNAANGNAIAKLPPTSSSGQIAFSPDGDLLAAADGKTIDLWNVDTQQLVVQLTGPTDSVYDVAFSPDGSTLVSTGYDNTVRVWQVTP
jgi:WD40 repeat protein